MNKFIKSIMILIVLNLLCGCNTESSENPIGTSGNAPLVQSGIDVLPLNEFNTDKYFENLTIEIVEQIDKHLIFKVTNNSNVCYERLIGDTYFKSDPLPGYLPLEDNEEYRNSFILNNIPAYSVTYHLEDSFYTLLGKYPEPTVEAYYPFELDSDPYRIEIDKEDSKISNKLIQDASEYLVFNRDDYDKSNRKLGTIENKSNHTIRFEGFVVFADGKIGEITNFLGNDRGSKYEHLIPKFNETFKLVDSYTCPVDFDYDREMTEEILKKECEPSKFSEIDSHSIYVENEDIEMNEYYDLYINAWFE